ACLCSSSTDADAVPKAYVDGRINGGGLDRGVASTGTRVGWKPRCREPAGGVLLQCAACANGNCVREIKPVGATIITSTATDNARAGATVIAPVTSSSVKDVTTTSSGAACVSPPNAIVAENCQTGNAAAEWDIIG